MYKRVDMKKFFGIWHRVKEIQDLFGVSYVAAHIWTQRGEIPAKYDYVLASHLKKIGKAVSVQGLGEWHKAHADRRKSIRDLKLSKEAAKAIPYPTPPWLRVKS